MNTTDKPVDLDTIGQVADALTERNDSSDAANVKAENARAIVSATSNAALTGIHLQIDALRNLARMIERRGEHLTDAINEHARICQEAQQSERIMSDAIAAIHKQFLNGLPPNLRLVANEGER